MISSGFPEKIGTEEKLHYAGSTEGSTKFMIGFVYKKH
jgi:hypothetical protein